MGKMFDSRVRDGAIETICSSLVMARLLLPVEVAGYMRLLGSYSDEQLSVVLCYSRTLLDEYLETCWSLN